MLKLKITKQYKKDHKKYRHKDLTELKIVIEALSEEQTPPPKYENHPLLGKLKGIKDCHVEPDFILLYQQKDNELKLMRLGSHSELFE